ncbi:MAG: selenocysteine-specific translation elongation factor [Phycisphaerales bacterium]|nr:MAG: selenocysteine-specific translation elongation factor [Phycisphaerales bacterium]
MGSTGEASETPAQTGSRFLILGTAGHIDHGKTALIRALTGTDTDRLPEEKRRGMTIELGFAELEVGPIRFGIVDVPGHERFVRTMVSGATAIDVALLVIAADDSVMPQTVEHLEILSLLNIRAAVVAITKTDIVDAELAELVEEEVRELIAETPLRDAPIVRVSSVTGDGIGELKQVLAETARRVSESESSPPFRMAVDRVFSVPGRGTVVTGSVLRGQVAVGDALEVWPAGVSCKVRDLQTHGRQSERIRTGERAALNIIGVDRGVLARGCDLATPGYLSLSRLIDARLHCLLSCQKAIRPFTRLRLCLGTREALVRVVPIERASIAPGQTTYVQLRSRSGIIATHGQRFIVRDEVASRTVGGGVVLHGGARRWTTDRVAERSSLEILDSGDEAARVSEVLRLAGFSPPSDLTVCAQAGVELDRLSAIYAELDDAGKRISLDSSGRPCSAVGVDDLLSRAVRWLDRFHGNNPEAPGCRADAFLGWLERKSAKGLARPLLDRLLSSGRVKALGQYVCRPEFAPALSAQDEKLLAKMVEEYSQAAFQPPRLENLKIAQRTNVQRLQRLAKVAEATGQLVEVQSGLYLHLSREQELRDVVRAMTRGGRGVTVSELRERLGSSRKYMVPIVEYLDRVGFTRRDGDHRFLKEST